MKRITSAFKKLVGKTVARVEFGGQFFGVVFTDETYIFLDAHSFSMSYDSEIADAWKADLGLIDRDEYKRQELARTRKSAALQHEFRRQAYLKLKAEFEPTT